MPSQALLDTGLPRGWYYQVQFNTACGRSAQTNKVCDEYPYATAQPGGRFWYLVHQVSVKIVSAQEQSIRYSGSQGNKLEKFYDNAHVVRNDPNLAWFIVSTTMAEPSHYYNRYLVGGKIPL
jgi:hypothetical protein